MSVYLSCIGLTVCVLFFDVYSYLFCPPPSPLPPCADSVVQMDEVRTANI